MTLQEALLKQLAAVRGEEWTLHRVLDADQRERTGTEAAPEIKELLARASAGRRSATRLLQGVGVACEVVEPGPIGTWEATHADAHEAMTGLWDAVEAATEDQLAADPGLRRNHPQYMWRDVMISAVRGPMLDYAGWHLRQGRSLEGLSV